MSTPIVTSHRNLHQRIAKLLSAKGLTPWQIYTISLALDDLQTGRHPEGERTMSQAERPDLYQPAGNQAGTVVTVVDLRRRMEDAATLP